MTHKPAHAGRPPLDLEQIGRKLSYVLRHRPDTLGVTVDTGGWASVEALLFGLAKDGVRLDRRGLEAVVQADSKQRFSLSSDGRRIRANQGHSRDVGVSVSHDRALPPEWLFHGTKAALIPTLKREGLRSMRRQYVHLSADEGTATTVAARRKGDAVVLRIAAGAMLQNGHAFYLAENGVWLSDQVPAQYIRFPQRSDAPV